MTTITDAQADVCHVAGWLHLEAAPTTDGTDNMLISGERWRALGKALAAYYAAVKASRRSEAEQLPLDWAA